MRRIIFILFCIWAASLSAQVQLPVAVSFTVKGVEFTLITVEGGTFKMGDEDDEAASPVHDVILSYYCIGQTEVTQELWEAVMGSNPSFYKGPKLPVEQVSWNDAKEFITKLNVLTNHKFRFPTEAEWEFAARGGKKSKGYQYSGSDNIDEVAWYIGNSNGKTYEVATKKPNELDIYDMTGNVYEWCQDGYAQYPSTPQTNPVQPVAPHDPYTVRRGGCWSNQAKDSKVTKRVSNWPISKYSTLGFRLAL